MNIGDKLYVKMG